MLNRLLTSRLSLQLMLTEIARNHPFIDGNKRTALVAARTFLILNGVDLDATQDEKVLTFSTLAEGAISEEELADWIRERIQL